MNHHTILPQAIALALGLLMRSLAPCASAQVAEPAQAFFEVQLRAVNSLAAQLNAVAAAADRGAARLCRGGKIYLSGEKGMVAELLGRAGGLCAAQALSPFQSRAVTLLVRTSSMSKANVSPVGPNMRVA